MVRVKNVLKTLCVLVSLSTVAGAAGSDAAARPLDEIAK